MRKAISIIGMILTLLAAAGCEKWALFLRQEFTATFNTTALLWSTGLVALVLAVVLVTLAWYVLCWCPRSKLVSIIFIVSGFATTFLMAAQLSLPYTILSPGMTELFIPNSRVILTGAIIAVIGVAGLVLPRHSKIS